MEREPGWYPHPQYPEDERWWDGISWGPSRPGGHRTAPPAPGPRPGKQKSVTVIVAYLLILVALYFGLWYFAAHTGDPDEPFFGPSAGPPVSLGAGPSYG